jgi:anaerobic selenocysteine-containing dehydrogenase
MSEKISRRDFLKIAGMGSAVTAVLTGCGPMSRYVVRQPYSDMPEYTVTGESTYFATTCGECPAGCGLVVRTMQGRAIKVEGNPAHPVSHGGTCSRGQATVEGLYNPDRVKDPGKQANRGSGTFEPLKWEDAISVVKEALQNPGQVAFFMGLFPDHLYNLVQIMADALGIPKSNLVRYTSLSEFEERNTLMKAAQNVLGESKIPYFDIENALVTFSFGANFVETWLSPVAYSNAYGKMRQGHEGQRGYLVHFESHLSQTGASSDEWIPIAPGSEADVALALGRLVAELSGASIPQAFSTVNVADAAAASGIPETQLRRLARIFADASRKVAIPGGVPMGSTNGQAAAEAILALNVQAGNLGKPGGVYFLPDFPIYPKLAGAPSSLAEISALINQMNSGQIKTLFVHGTNPVYNLPQALGFSKALEKVPLVISFASFPDETAEQADYVFPDNTPLESWGYQRIVTGSDMSTVSGLQPVVLPLYDTRPTVDVLLAAAQAIGGDLTNKILWVDEVDFLQKSVAELMDQDGFYSDVTQAEFWAQWQKYGGWWKNAPDWLAPVASPDQPITPPAAQFSGTEPEFNLLLLPFPHPNLADGSVTNRPWLQESPDPMTTVMWNSWVEINPDTAKALGVSRDDVVMITTPVGAVEASVYEYPGIPPNIIAIPLGFGHTALGRYAKGFGINVLDLLDVLLNEAGDLAFMATRAKVTATGKRRLLATYESKKGVYGE